MRLTEKAKHSADGGQMKGTDRGGKKKERKERKVNDSMAPYMYDTVCTTIQSYFTSNFPAIRNEVGVAALSVFKALSGHLESSLYAS